MPRAGTECNRNKWYIKEEFEEGVGWKVAILHMCTEKHLEMRYRGREIPLWTDNIVGGPSEQGEGITGAQLVDTMTDSRRVNIFYELHADTNTGVAKFAM